MDIYEDFKDRVRLAAVSLGHDEVKVAAILSSMILRKPSQKSSFTKAALRTLESVKELEHFIVRHRKDYLDLHRTTEQERDSIEHEVSIFIKACKEQIDILKDRTNEELEVENSGTWLSLREDKANADLVAHRHGVVLILSEKLHSVTSKFDHLRAIRFQEIINRTVPRKKFKRASVAKILESSTSDGADFREHDVTSASLKHQAQELDDETRALQVELTSLLDATRVTETKMLEMSALNHLMSTHVLQQAQQIEQLYEQAVQATLNVESGNKELSQAIQRNKGSRTFILLFFFVLTFSILFLDWYS